MVNNDTLVKVTNRSNCFVGYTVPELNARRRFAAGETKEVEAKELRALAWNKGGKNVLQNHLVIHNEELVNELIYNVQPEYYYSVDDVIQLLLYGSTDQLLDALDFGGDGVKSLIKDKAVELNLNDVRKREIIQEKTGFNVTGAIQANKQSETVIEEVKYRRAAPITTTGNERVASEAPARRTAAPKYKVAITTEE